MTPEAIADTACQIGENPLWHVGHERVYWVDIPAGKLFRYAPADGSHELCHEGEAIGGFTIQADGALLLFGARGAVTRWDDGTLSTVIDEIPDQRDSRFNDVIADPAGRVFCGTMPAGGRLGKLFRLDLDGSLSAVVDEVGCSNGMGFTPAGDQMYFTDSKVREISLFDYDRATGKIANRRVFLQTPEGEGVPDGMTVDAEGFVWSARWDGGCIVRYAPEGREVSRVEFPVARITSLIFGGPDARDVYVTTAGGEDKAAAGPHAGALFHFRAEVAGVAEFRSRIQT